jgi:rRNA-processing protein FCF1
LIAEVALKNGYVLLTADRDLYEVAQRLNIGVMYWAVWRPNDRLNPTP